MLKPIAVIYRELYSAWHYTLDIMFHVFEGFAGGNKIFSVWSRREYSDVSKTLFCFLRASTLVQEPSSMITANLPKKGGLCLLCSELEPPLLQASSVNSVMQEQKTAATASCLPESKTGRAPVATMTSGQA